MGRLSRGLWNRATHTTPLSEPLLRAANAPLQSEGVLLRLGGPCSTGCNMTRNILLHPEADPAAKG